VQVAATKPSLTFFQPDDIRKQGVDVWTDDDEWDVRLTPTNPTRPKNARTMLTLYLPPLHHLLAPPRR
jgi:hypothetical protein